MFESFMKIAIREATLAKQEGEVPVGAIIVNASKEIIARGRNMTRNSKDPTAHAEILAIQQACRNLNSERLIGCSIYVTLEPCAMCASAISAARLKNLFYGLTDPKSGGVENGAKIFSHNQTHFKPDIYSGFCEEEIKKLMNDFFIFLRKSNTS